MFHTTNQHSSTTSEGRAEDSTVHPPGAAEKPAPGWPPVFPRGLDLSNKNSEEWVRTCNNPSQDMQNNLRILLYIYINLYHK